MKKVVQCHKCEREVPFSEGLEFTIYGSDEQQFFCRKCLKEALTILGMKPSKNKDEVELLSHIRKFISQTAN